MVVIFHNQSSAWLFFCSFMDHFVAIMSIIVKTTSAHSHHHLELNVKVSAAPRISILFLSATGKKRTKIGDFVQINSPGTSSQTSGTTTNLRPCAPCTTRNLDHLIHPGRVSEQRVREVVGVTSPPSRRALHSFHCSSSSSRMQLVFARQVVFLLSRNKGQR